PQNGYRGDYVRAIAERLKGTVGERLRHPSAAVYANIPPDEPQGDKEKHIDALIARARELIGAEGFRQVQDLSVQAMLDDIRDDLRQFGVEYERWYSERSLESSGAIDRALARLREQGRLYEQNGAIWFRATEFGDEKD